MAKTNFQFIDEYIAACPEETHEWLQTIRAEGQVPTGSTSAVEIDTANRKVSSRR